MSVLGGSVPTRGTHAVRQVEIGYNPALDGVRGVAVLAIMAYHGGVLLTRGGFYSLDTFFTLSGFLITTLLVAEWQRSAGIALGRFWARRARRLLPALLVMILAVTAYAEYVATLGTYPALRGDAFSTLFYVANWHFVLSGSNYFAMTGATSPLLHTWSLAIEEQFYLIWPVVALLVLRSRFGLPLLLAVSAIGAFSSALVMALLYSPATQNRVYYGTDTRAQSLLVGAALSVALALLAQRGRTPSHDAAPSRAQQVAWRAPSGRLLRFVTALGWAGVAVTALLWTQLAADNALAFRGGFLLAAGATAAVLASLVLAPSGALARCLGVRPLRDVGRISYGLYLWHFPVFLWFDHARSGLDGWGLFAARLALTTSIATVSFYVIELPIRQRRLLKTWTAWLATPAAFVVTASVVVVATSSSTLAASTMFHVPSNHTDGIYAGPPVKVLLVGDSTAYTLGLGLSTYAHDYNVSFANAGILGCGFTDGSEYELKGVEAPMDAACSGAGGSDAWQHQWLTKISSQHPNVVMILAGRWEVVNRTYRGGWTNILDPEYATYVRRQMMTAVHIAAANGAKVMLLTAPCYDTGEQPNGQPWPEDSPTRLARYNDIVRQVAAASRDTSLFNFNAVACPSGHYQSYIQGVDARYDGVHFTLGGGVVFDSSLLPVAEQLGREQMAER